MANVEVSLEQVKVYLAARSTGDEWATASDIGGKTDVVPRTVRHHLAKLTDLGLLEKAVVFPAHRYRASGSKSPEAAAHRKRLEDAIAVFGLN